MPVVFRLPRRSCERLPATVRHLAAAESSIRAWSCRAISGGIADLAHLSAELELIACQVERARLCLAEVEAAAIESQAGQA